MKVAFQSIKFQPAYWKFVFQFKFNHIVVVGTAVGNIFSEGNGFYRDLKKNIIVTIIIVYLFISLYLYERNRNYYDPKRTVFKTNNPIYRQTNNKGNYWDKAVWEKYIPETYS
jgi:hypothetical protein